MPEPKFSPGEWSVETVTLGIDWFEGMLVKSSERETYVADTFNGYKLKLISREECEANARLIAAAPYLFGFARHYAENSACSCDDWMTTCGEKCRHCIAVALIEKATKGA